MGRLMLAVGRAARGVQIIAYKCSWCGRWFSQADYTAAHNGATVSHGACTSCAKKMLADPFYRGPGRSPEAA